MSEMPLAGRAMAGMQAQINDLRAALAAAEARAELAEGERDASDRALAELAYDRSVPRWQARVQHLEAALKGLICALDAQGGYGIDSPVDRALGPARATLTPPPPAPETRDE
jgi:hypothetical protein